LPGVIPPAHDCKLVAHLAQPGTHGLSCLGRRHIAEFSSSSFISTSNARLREDTLFQTALPAAENESNNQHVKSVSGLFIP